MDSKNSAEIKHDINVYAAFEKHFVIFVATLGIIWMAWFAMGGGLSVYAWPSYASFAWMLILVVHLIVAYRTFKKVKTQTRQ